MTITQATKTIRRGAAGAALAVAVALALTACGGSGSSPHAATAAAGPIGGGKHHHGREHGVRGRHGHGRKGRGAKAKRKTAPAVQAKPVVAHGSTAKFSQAATGRASALKKLAASVLSAGTTGGKPGGVPTFHYRNTSTTTTETAFAKQADAICSSYRTNVHQIASQATNLSSQENEMQNLVNATAAALKQLQALTPPAAQASLAAQYVSLISASVSNFVLAQTRSTSTKESVGTQQELTDMGYADSSSHDATNAQKMAKKLGFHVCGSTGAEWL